MSPKSWKELKLIGTFAVAGLVIPFVLFPLWQLTVRDHPVLTLEHFLSIEYALFPGMRGTIVGWTGPWNWSLIVTMWIEALAKNAAICAVTGPIVVLIARFARKRFG